MSELFQNREQNIEHVGIYIAEHRKQFPCIAGALGHPIAGVQHRSVWLGLKARADKLTCHIGLSGYVIISLEIYSNSQAVSDSRNPEFWTFSLLGFFL